MCNLCPLIWNTPQRNRGGMHFSLHSQIFHWIHRVIGCTDWVADNRPPRLSLGIDIFIYIYIYIIFWGGLTSCVKICSCLKMTKTWPTINGEIVIFLIQTAIMCTSPKRPCLAQGLPLRHELIGFGDIISDYDVVLRFASERSQQKIFPTDSPNGWFSIGKITNHLKQGQVSKMVLPFTWQPRDQATTVEEKNLLVLKQIGQIGAGSRVERKIQQI